MPRRRGGCAWMVPSVKQRGRDGGSVRPGFRIESLILPAAGARGVRACAGAFVEQGWYYFRTIMWTALCGQDRMSTGRFVLYGLLGSAGDVLGRLLPGAPGILPRQRDQHGRRAARQGTGGTVTRRRRRDRRTGRRSAGDRRRAWNRRPRHGRRAGNRRHRGDGRRARERAASWRRAACTGTGGIVATGGVTGDRRHRGDGRRAGDGRHRGDGWRAGNRGCGRIVRTAKNCVDAIKLAGYSAGTGSSCSACKENGADKSTNCMKVIDCLDTNYPCGSANNCALQCNNSGRSRQHRQRLRDLAALRRRLHVARCLRGHG